MLVAALAALLLVPLTVAVHYETLSLLIRWVDRKANHDRRSVVVVVLATFLAHSISVWLYAAAYFVLHHGAWGSFGGEFRGTWLEFVYFSTVSYTSLGLGDVYPLGAMRLLTGIEALNGLTLITWSASFAYLVMRRVWTPNSNVGES
jgi:hypothetical protein